MNRKLSLNTHHYDGKLVFKEEEEGVEAFELLSLEDALEKAVSLAELHCHRRQVRFAKNTLFLLASEAGNYDSSNGLEATLLFRHIMSREDLDGPLLCDVLIEITKGGSCPQGRTTRLLQLLKGIQ